MSYHEDETEYCMHCMTEMISAYDDDPNGDSNCVCIRCRVEESIDFDECPDTVVCRNGSIVGEDEEYILTN